VVRNAGKSAEEKSDELALLTTLNERLKSGDVTVSYSRRWTDFEEYLIPRSLWAVQRTAHYANLGLPLDVDTYLAGNLSRTPLRFFSAGHAIGR